MLRSFSKRFGFAVFGFVVGLSGVTAYAEIPVGVSQEKTSSVLGLKKYEESGTITDPKLKADAGSLSALSMKASLSYFGPTLGDWSAPDQPNPDGSVGSYAQAIKGSISARYRVSSDASFSAGTGISLNHPFHGMDRTDASNPFLSYDFSNRFGEWQMRNSPGMTVSTVPNYTAIGQIGGVSWDNSNVVNIGTSRFSISFDTNLAYWIYSRDYRPGSTKKGGDGLAQQYTISWYPGIKYNFSSRLNLYSSLGFQLYNPRQMNDSGVLWNRSPTVRVGLGWGLSRDFYLAPYISSFTNRLQADSTTFNVSGIFSIL